MDILEDLRKNICEVTFTKKNGDERTMICTLLPDYLPFSDEQRDTFIADAQKRELEKDQVTVWDLESDAWRSFKPSKVTNIEFSPE